MGVTLTDALTSSAADSHASRYPLPAAGRPRTTSGGSGLSSPASFASLDPDGSWLRTSPDSSVQASLLGPLLARFSGTWPRSGSMHAGIVYAHPTLARPTSASGSSSWLGTPSAADAMGGHLSRGGARSDELLLKGQIKALHTPTATDGSPRYDHRASPGYTRAIPVPNLDAQIAELLPTPRHEGYDAGNHRGQPDSLNQTVRMLPTPKVPTPKVPTGGAEKRSSRKKRGSGGEDLAASIGELTNQPSEDGGE
jgi:hypothetical protein